VGIKRLIFVISHWCNFFFSPFPSLCNGSGVSATFGSDFLELNVGWLASMFELQGHYGNDALVVVI